MAHGTPDLSDLMAVFEEQQQVATTLHQISSGQNVDVRQGVANLPFTQPGLPFSTDMDPQAQLSQIPELDHALSGNAFLSSDIVREPSARNNTFGNGSEGIGSLGSLFLSSIESQIDPVKSDDTAFNRSMPQHNIPKPVTSKPTQQNPSNTKSTFQQIRTNKMPHHPQRNPTKSSYSQYGNSLDMEQATVALHTTAISSGELAANSSMGSLPFIVPSEVQPIVPHFQIGATQKKVQNNQFVQPLPGTRQQPVPTNPPRPLSAASSTSEHLSRPGSVQQPSPTCGSNHSGDPATPLTPQSYNAGTPVYYKPATPGVNATVQQHTRTPGYMDIHHSPQIQQVVSPKMFPTTQHSVVGFQSQPSSQQSIMASNEALNELPTPIKDALDPVNDIGSFHNPNTDIDPDLWGPESAVMSPNSLFVNTTSAQSSSNPPLITPDQNIGFGYSNDVYGTGFASYPNRFQPRDELPCEESLTEKQNAILEQLSTSGMKKAGAQTMQQPSIMGQAGNKSDQFGVHPSSGTSTIDLMNKATNAGHATVEKLLGSQYEAISPVSDPSMSPASKSNLPEEFADSIFAPPKFTSPTDLPSHQQDQRPPTSNQPDPVLMYVTKDGNRSSQDDLSNLLANDNVPELIHYSETGWPSQSSAPKASSIATSQMQPISSVSNHPATANVSLQEPSSFNQWNANMNILPPNFGMIGNSQQTSRGLMGASTLSSVSDMTAAHSMTTSQNIASHSPVVASKDRKPFGVARVKSGTDRGKATAKSGMAGGSSDPTFGFESDDETESICLNKVTPVTSVKKAPKPPQSNSASAKPRMAFSIPASDDLRQQMETVKQLQQQQLRLQRIQAFQSQNVPSATPVSQAKHPQTRVQPKPAAVNQPLHHDFLRTKKVTEAPEMRVNHTVGGVTPYTNSYISHTISAPSNAQRLLSKPAPLSLAQPNPGYGDASRYKQSQQAPILSQPLFPPTTPRIPNFTETTRMSSDTLLHSITPHYAGVRDDKLHVPPSSVLYPSHSVSASTLPLQIPALLSTLPPKSIVAPSAVSSLPSSVQVQSSPALAAQVPVTYSPLTGMQSDSVNMNLDWLNKEPDRIVAEKSQTPLRDYRNASTPPNAVLPPSSIAPRGNHLLFSSDSAARLASRRLPDDDALPLKQSIHTVDHLSVPKTHPVVSATFTPTTAPKRHMPTETRHLNFKKHRILEGALPSTNIKPTPTTSSISTFTPSKTSVTVAHSVLDKQRQYMKEHGSQRLKQKQSQAPESTAASAAVTFASRESTSSSVVKTSAAEKNKTKQGNKSGSMFMLFNSLLQEASSESPAKSVSPSKEEKVDKQADKVPALPEKIPDKPPTNVPREQKSVNPPVPASLPKEQKLNKSPCKVPASETKSDKAMEPIASKNDKLSKTKPSAVQPDAVKPKPAVRSAPAVSITPVSVTSSTVATVTAHTVPANRSVNEIKKPAKKNWSASAMPLKRRYFDDAQSKLRAASKVTTVTTAASAVPVSKSKTSVPAVKVPVSKVVGPSTLSVASTLVEKTPVCSTVASSVAPLSSVSAVNSDKAAAAGSALKLRITAFRSTRGDIIHQSAMLSKEEEAAGSDQSARRKSKKKRKKRERKKRKKTPLSDDDSEASSQSKADQRAKLLEKAKINEQITKELDEIARMAAIKEKAAAAAARSSPLKRKRARGNDSDATADAKKAQKRVKISKVIPKKKPDPKTVEPVARYLPKSALQATAGMNVVSSASAKVPITIPSSYQRVPGRLPLYLSTSDGKAIGAPTIQLVARNSSKATGADNKNLPSPKIVNVKVSSAPRSISTQLLSNTNVQYIIPATKPQARVIVTNISTAATVSPVIVRSFPGGLVPLSVGSLSTTASTKPQLFSVPLSVNESTLQRNNSAKMMEKAKAQSPVKASNALSSRRSHTSVAKQVASSISFLTKSRCTAGLTGTLDTPRVTTKVLSPNGDNQEDASNFQSVLLSLITSPNPVSNYAPPQPPASLDLSEQESFHCLACEDRFLFRECLKDHHDRRSILIKVRCMQCDKDMVFLNKCKLLMHARQHSDGMQFNNAHISPLPLSMCKARSKDWFLENTVAACDDSSSRQRNISTASSDVDSSVASAPISLTCTECNFTAASAETLEEHFQRTSPPPSPDKSGAASKTATCFVCDICSVSIPNQCSFMAHMRMHKRARPHTCPECGQTFDSSGVEENGNSENKREFDFNLHLSVQCFHLSRITAFKCTLCGLICKNAELLRRHLEDRHLQTFYKCRDCPMAFKTQENIASHQRSAHGIVAITKTIYKCPLCDMVFTDNNATQQLFLLQKHFEGHMSHPTIHITAYKCLFCENIYERKSLLRDHLKTVHDVTASGDAEVNDPKAVTDDDANGNSKKDGKGQLGSQKLTRTALIEGSNARIASGHLGNKELMKKKSGDLVINRKNAMQPLKLRLKGLGNPVSDSSKTGSSRDMSNDSSAVGNAACFMRDGKKIFPCGQCSKELLSASTRINHIRLKHQGIRTMFCCPYCPVGKIRFAKNISMKKHLKKIHQLEEITKQDVRIEYVKLPIGQRFDQAILNADEGGSAPPEHTNAVGSKVRKKFTRPVRKSNRAQRQTRHDLTNASLYAENSDSEVEKIMSNRVADDDAGDRSDQGDVGLDFSVLKFPSVYLCAKCEHQCADRLEFQAHILEHKDDVEMEGITGTIQCTECGLCFASESSHTKHLFIKHKVRKRKLLEKYDAQLKERRKANGSLPYRLTEGYAGNPDGSSDCNVKMHKCTVCFKRFGDGSQLRTHMRTHGLAFVKSKHAS